MPSTCAVSDSRPLTFVSVTRSVLFAASKSQFLNHHATRRAFVRRAVKKFMPGDRPEDALAAGAQLPPTRRGAVFTPPCGDVTRPPEGQTRLAPPPPPVRPDTTSRPP